MSIVGYVLTAFSIALGILYFMSNRRHAEMQEAREDLKRVSFEQDALKERVAVMETTAQFLDVQIKTLCESTDKKMDGMMGSYKDLLLDIKNQFAETIRDLRVSVNQLQNTISDLRVNMAEHK